MRNLVFGSYSARGKKKRRNISRFTLSVPSTAAITNLRRRAITLPSSESSLLEKILRNACARDGFDLGGGVADPAGSNVEFAILSPLNLPRTSLNCAEDSFRRSGPGKMDRLSFNNECLIYLKMSGC